MAKTLQPGDGPATEVLLVEGADDYHFFGHFRNLQGLDYVFRVEDGKGVDTILTGLSTRLKADNENHLGVVLDADMDIVACWQVLQHILTHAGYQSVPAQLDSTGAILEQENLPVIGLWLMPDNVVEGSLETFVSRIRKTDERVWQRAEAVVEQIPEDERLFKSTSAGIIKAKVHTWLAWQEEPGTPLGQALRKGYLQVDAPQALLLADWLRRLFST